MRPVRPAAIDPPISTPLRAAFTKIDWSNIGLTLTPAGRSFFNSGITLRTPSTTASVETPPVFRTIIRLPGRPPTVTELSSNLETIVNVSNVSDEDQFPVDFLDWKIVNALNDVRGIVHRDRVVTVSQFHVAGGKG